MTAANESISSLLLNKTAFINPYLIIMPSLLLISFFIPVEFNASNNIEEKFLNDRIPKVIVKWHAEDFQIENNYYSVLGTNDILMRGYKKNIKGAGEETVYLFMTRSKKNRRFAHPPNACLEGEEYNLANEDFVD